MFEWLFNYPRRAWAEGTFSFDADWPVALLVSGTVLVFVLLWWGLSRQSLSTSRRLTVLSLQMLVVGGLLFMSWKPVLKLDVAEQGENSVAWLVDASASMSTPDAQVQQSAGASQQTRLQAATNIVQQLALDDDAEFQADLYVQGDSLQQIDSTDQLVADNPSSLTDLAGGLDEILGTVNQTAVAAVVLLSDGSDNAGSVDAQWWQRIASAGVPVHTIGFGKLNDPSDVQLNDVRMPRNAPADVSLNATITVAHAVGGSARVRVLSGRDLIAAVDIELPDGVPQSQHVVSFPSGESGVRQLQFEVLPEGDRADPQLLNNSQQRILRVNDTRSRILYIEGEPRWEYKFLRRALEGNPSVEVVSLLRTSPNKFYRQGVRDENELADGFPADRQTLFEYDAVIVGSLEAAELSTTQQLALRDFVSIRGGSLLMLGGRHGLADGGWGRSVVAAALPTILDARLSANTFERSRVQVLPTVSGYRTAWLELDPGEQANQQAWQGLPDVADIQDVGAVKPGAVVLLGFENTNARGIGVQPLLVSQRYGKGQSFVFGTSGTWRWQMGLDSSDQRHEIFWSQLLTQLVSGVVPRIRVETSDLVFRDTDNAELSLTAFAADYTPLQQATLTALMTLPDGSAKSVEFAADTQHPGQYQARVALPMDGPYMMGVQAPLDGESAQGTPARAELWWTRESGTAESFNNTQQQQFLQRVADVTGGSYLPLNEAGSVIDVLAQKNAALKREVSLPLWNMPILFLGLLLAKVTEWLLRLRWKRL